MNPKNNLIPSVLLICVTLGSHSALAQGGSLVPPGAPGPSMRTLDEIGEAAEAAADAADPRTPITAADLPLTIDQPGSYIFTEDMVFSAETGNAITITSSNVTLDLMGFSLRSSPEVTGDGVRVSAYTKNITIRNGQIAGNTEVVEAPLWTTDPAGFNYGIFFPAPPDEASAKPVTLEGLHVSGCRFSGIFHHNGHAVIRSCAAISNGGSGISTDGSVSNTVAYKNAFQGIIAKTITNSIAQGNGDDGIVASYGSVSNCVAERNGGDGISASNASVSNCVASSNYGNGISASEGSVSHCVARGNNSNGISAPNGSVSHSTARNNYGGDGIRVTSKGVVAFCMASNNEGEQINAPEATRTGNYPTP